MDERPKVVLVGGGHAHLHALRRVRAWVRRGLDVTLVAPEPFWYSGMGPGLLSGRYRPDHDQVDVAALVREGGGRVVKTAARRVDAAAREVVLEDGRRLPYDVLSLNVGSGIPMDGVEGLAAVGFPVKPVSTFAAMRGRMAAAAARGDRCRVVVIGGGPAGCESAGNALAAQRELGLAPAVVLVNGGARLLQGHPRRAGRIAARRLAQRGAEILPGRLAASVDAGSVTLDDGRRLEADLVVAATGIRPSRVIDRSRLPSAVDGSLAVNAFLQCDAHPEIFGGGDCIAFGGRPLPRVGVYAVRQGPILYHNIAAQARGKPLRRFRPQRRFLLILNLGDQTGLLLWRGLTLHGRWAFRLKEWLDQRFLRDVGGGRAARGR